MFSGQRRNEFNRGIEYDTRQSPPVTVECGRRRYAKGLQWGHQGGVVRREPDRYERS